MPNTINSPNMSLPVPVVGVDPGPQYATDLDSCLTIIDGHDHSPGSGVPVTPAGLDISSDLTFNDNNATALRSTRFSPQGSPLSQPTDQGCLYEAGVDLWYNDGSGNQIRITKSGSIAGTPGSIGGLIPPASVTYVVGPGTFVFESDINTPANIDVASITIRDETALSHGITINAPAALAADYSINLMGSLPTSVQLLAIDQSGNVTTVSSGGSIVGPGGTYSTIAAAIAGTSAGGYITVLAGTYTENITLNKNLTIVGQGNGTILNGTLTFATSSDESVWRSFQINGNITLNSGVSEISLTEFWLGHTYTITDNSTGSYIQGFQE